MTYQNTLEKKTAILNCNNVSQYLLVFLIKLMQHC